MEPVAGGGRRGRVKVRETRSEAERHAGTATVSGMVDAGADAEGGMDAGMEGMFDFSMEWGRGTESSLDLDLDLGTGLSAGMDGKPGCWAQTQAQVSQDAATDQLDLTGRGSGTYSRMSGLSPTPATSAQTQAHTQTAASDDATGTPLTAMYCIVRNGECGLCRDLVGLTSRVWDDATVGMLEKAAADLEEWEAGWMGRRVRVRGEDGFVER